MLTTTLLMVSLASLLLVSLLLWMLFLRLGLRWAKVQGVSTRRLLLATILIFLLQSAIASGFFVLSLYTDSQLLGVTILEPALIVFTSCLIISRLFQLRTLRACKAWLPTLLASAIVIAFTHLVIRPVLFEAFYLPTNAMAPTLLGYHWRGVCPECGESSFCSPMQERLAAKGQVRMVCLNFHNVATTPEDMTVHSSDRILVAKFLTPRRWDLIVFQNPSNPTMLYVKRLIGLPGESIHIEQGAVWANGEKVDYPTALRGQSYRSEPPDNRQGDLWGSPQRPALLGDEEYFVLGDFTTVSNDSRYWVAGAPGHAPYAVPQSHIQGVVTHTFWPPHRWRIHR